MDAFIGTILLWPIKYAPDGWMFCRGQELQISQYQALFSLLGTQYGGNGTTTFMLPDLQSRVPVGLCVQQPSIPNLGNLGAAIGSWTSTVDTSGLSGSVKLTVDNLPAHSHDADFQGTGAGSEAAKASIAIPALSAPPASTANTEIPGKTVTFSKGAAGANSAKIYSSANTDTTLKPFNADVTGGLWITGGIVAVHQTGSGKAAAVSISGGGAKLASTAQPGLVLNYIIAIEGIYPPKAT